MGISGHVWVFDKIWHVCKNKIVILILICHGDFTMDATYFVPGIHSGPFQRAVSLLRDHVSLRVPHGSDCVGPIPLLTDFETGFHMEDLDQVTRILVLYAQRGFDKVTMTEIAAAARVSRQTLYNRFKTKDGILAWASEGFSRHARLKACAKLKDADASTSDCLVAAFSERMGLLVPLIHNLAYGPDILDRGTKLRLEAQAEFEPFHADFTKDLSHFLQVRGVCQSLSVADETSFLLMMSGKGLLMATRTREEFDAGMARVVSVILGEAPFTAAAGTPYQEGSPEKFPTGKSDHTSKSGDGQ